MKARCKVLVLADFDGTLCEFKAKPRSLSLHERGLAVSVGRHSDHAALTVRDVESVYRFLLTII